MCLDSIRLFELVPGIKSEPLFSSQEDYNSFYASFVARVTPELDKHKIARAESERAAMYHFIS